VPIVRLFFSPSMLRLRVITGLVGYIRVVTPPTAPLLVVLLCTPDTRLSTTPLEDTFRVVRCAAVTGKVK
jgi:hypothetical protein